MSESRIPELELPYLQKLEPVPDGEKPWYSYPLRAGPDVAQDMANWRTRFEDYNGGRQAFETGLGQLCLAKLGEFAKALEIAGEARSADLIRDQLERWSVGKR